MAFGRWGTSGPGKVRQEHERWVREQQRTQTWRGDGCGCDEEGCGDCDDCGDGCCD